MILDANEVFRIAALARLDLDPGEVTVLRNHLARILEHVTTLAELDLNGVPAWERPAGTGAGLRPDRVRPSLPAEEAVRPAPFRAGNLFRVPGVPRG